MRIMDSGEEIVQKIVDKNKTYWNDHASFWFGTTALPQYGVQFPAEEELKLFGDVTGRKLLDICCGSGHSIKYHADRNAGELWGIDISQKQLDNAEKYLAEYGYTANLICSSMEEMDLPQEYFDYVYSIYGIGWTTDLQGTFHKIASSLKKDGIFIFSWNHTLHHCVAFSRETGKNVLDDGKMTFESSYFDESYYIMPVHDSEVVLCNRMISTYVNALAKAGFLIEQMIEQSASDPGDASDKAQKAKMIPISVCFKARKL